MLLGAYLCLGQTGVYALLPMDNFYTLLQDLAWCHLLCEAFQVFRSSVFVLLLFFSKHISHTLITFVSHFPSYYELLIFHVTCNLIFLVYVNIC